jgi:hypothetical protein
MYDPTSIRALIEPPAELRNVGVNVPVRSPAVPTAPGFGIV